jgi:hypothetical protein
MSDDERFSMIISVFGALPINPVREVSGVSQGGRTGLRLADPPPTWC